MCVLGDDEKTELMENKMENNFKNRKQGSVSVRVCVLVRGVWWAQNTFSEIVKCNWSNLRL